MSKQLKQRVSLALLLCALVVLGWWLLQERTPDFGDPPDFAGIRDTTEMKAAFYDYLRPIVEHQNSRIEAQRERLVGIRKQLQEGQSLGYFDRRWLRELAQQYETDWDETAQLQLAQQLLHRVDIVPVELALVQAAKESGWGRSRFAIEANNYFGQWCYQPGCGIVPSGRGAKTTHEVEKFDSVSESVRRYMNNLNTHERYDTVREIRAKIRAAERPITGAALAGGLVFYSERREAYVQEVKAMIQSYLKFTAD